MLRSLETKVRLSSTQQSSWNKWKTKLQLLRQTSAVLCPALPSLTRSLLQENAPSLNVKPGTPKNTDTKVTFCLVHQDEKCDRLNSKFKIGHFLFFRLKFSFTSPYHIHTYIYDLNLLDLDAALKVRADVSVDSSYAPNEDHVWRKSISFNVVFRQHLFLLLFSFSTNYLLRNVGTII